MLRTILSLAALATLPLAAQTEVETYQPGLTPNGITYFLPKTAVRFVVKATRTTHHPGQYAKYAERFFGITDAPMTEYDVWALDEITPVVYGLPDETQAYTIALNPKTSAPLVTLTPDGLLLAVNAETTLPAPLPTASIEPVKSDNLKVSDYLTPDILRAGNVGKKAELTAEEIYDIRENRSLLSKGQADFNPTDGDQMRLMMEQLDKSETALMSLFTGTTTSTHYTYISDFVPNAVCTGAPFFRFSKHLGLVDNEDLSGEPYFLTLQNETTLPTVVDDPKAKSKKEANDLRYRVPGRGRIIINNTRENVTEFTLPIAQFGKIEHLGGDLFNKKYTTHVTLNAVTGNIEKIESDQVEK